MSEIPAVQGFVLQALPRRGQRRNDPSPGRWADSPDSVETAALDLAMKTLAIVRDDASACPRNQGRVIRPEKDRLSVASLTNCVQHEQEVPRRGDVFEQAYLFEDLEFPSRDAITPEHRAIR